MTLLYNNNQLKVILVSRKKKLFFKEFHDDLNILKIKIYKISIKTTLESFYLYVKISV